MFVAMAEDIRVILIKLADRLHNMRTLGFLPQDRQMETAEETLEVFAPLAHRLGMFRMKAELEDTALRFLEPQQYQELIVKVAKRQEEREDYLQSAIDHLREKLREVEIECEIQGRAKHFYSIYKKMLEQEKDFSEIYDLIAIRVLVNNVRIAGVWDYYSYLWKPVPYVLKIILPCLC